MSKVLSYKGFTGSIDVDMEDQILHGRVQHINDIVSYEAESPALLKLEFEQAVNRYLDYCERKGQSPCKPHSGTLNIRIGAVLHGQAAVAAMSKGISINEWITLAIEAAVAPTPPATNIIVHINGKSLERHVGTAGNPADWSGSYAGNNVISSSTH